MLATLAHDFGKAVTTRMEGNKITSHGHESAGIAIAKEFLASINAPNNVVESVMPLVAHHMCRIQEPSPKKVRRLAVQTQPATLNDLLLVMRADANGHGNNANPHKDYLNALQSLAAELKVEAEAPKPILLGRHLIKQGLTPGEHFGKILKQAFEAQINGEFHDEQGGLQWLKEFLMNSP